MQDDNLDELRAQIDSVDAEIITSLAKRFEIVSKVKELKQANNLEVRDKKREDSLLAKVGDLAEKNGLDASHAKQIYEAILAESRKSQEK